MTDILPMPFTGAVLDACEHSRSADDLKAFMDDPRARAIVLHEGKPLLTEAFALDYIEPSKLIGMNLYDPGPLFLGTADGAPIFAFSIQNPDMIAEMERFGPMRAVSGYMPPQDLAIAGMARSYLDWHFNHTFCAKCGCGSAPVTGGLKRVCPSCSTEHFPRVNPVAIMLVVDKNAQGEESVLLGRGPGWPDGFYSALAGFVSPGESLEECCIREVREEAGISVTDPQYVFSQPWPFPSQLMMGLICRAQSREIKIDKQELEDARWFTRSEVEAVFAKTGNAFMRPPRFTIAHQLLKYWLKTGKA